MQSVVLSPASLVRLLLVSCQNIILLLLLLYIFNFFYTVSNLFLPTICEISWPIEIDDSETPLGTDIAFYKKNLPDIPDMVPFMLSPLYTSEVTAM